MTQADIQLQPFVAEVAAYTEKHLDAYIDTLRELCAIDSGTFYKVGIDKLGSSIATLMRDFHMETTMFEQEQWGNDILGRIWGTGKKTILLLGHMDTVYPEGIAAARPLKIAGEKIIGPGTCDMKGCILAALYTIKAMLAFQHLPFKELRLLCVSDEEISQRHSVPLIQSIARDCDAVFVLEAARANGDIVSARKGTAWYTLTARGKAAHVGVEPEKGRNAILELAHQILSFQTIHNWREGVSISPGVIKGGTMPNVVPEYAEARIDLRFLLHEDRLETEKRWDVLLQQKYIEDVDMTLRMEAYGSPMICTPASLELILQGQRIAAMLGFDLSHTITGGSSDASHISPLHLPVVDGLGPVGGCDHSPDEYLLLESIAPRTALLAGLIAAAGN